MSAPVVPTSLSADRIRAVNHHLRLALDQVSDGVLILQNGIGEIRGPVIVWGNAAAIRWTGFTPAELAGVSLYSLLAPDSWQLLQSSLRAVFQNQSVVCPLRLRAPGSVPMEARAQAALGPAGEILSVILTFRPLPGGGTGSAVMSMPGTPAPVSPPASFNPAPPPSPEGWQDDVIETIRETARQVAHEFNNALTSIVLPVEMAINAIPQSGELFESLRVAYDSAQQATDLAKDFLDCFRPRPAVRVTCAPGELLGRAMRLATCAQNIAATLELAAGLEAIDVDESQLERVIFNLIRNACQAMPNGGRLRVSAANCRVSAGDGVALPAGPYVRISVRDWGPGIPEEHRRHLFHCRFTTKPRGNGCGLSICYQIVRDHGGEMMVRSKVHVGAEFIIYLPSAGVVPAAARPDRVPDLDLLFVSPANTSNSAIGFLRAPVAEHQRGGCKKADAPDQAVDYGAGHSLLVVDDELGVRRALSQIAHSRGFDVAVVATSDAALQSYKDRLHARQPFSAVLLDLNLRSGLNGLEVFAAIRRMNPEASVVATSGQYGHGDVERFEAMGFAGFLPKPYTLECFDRLMRTALAL